MGTDQNKNEKAKGFLKKVADEATKMVNLEIKTYVGSMSYNETSKAPEFIVSDGMSSKIDLLQGDITTNISIGFHENYKDLMKFHQNREKNGQDIIKNNIEIVKSLVETIKDFIDQE